jgi:Tol biopolymer transport system component
MRSALFVLPLCALALFLVATRPAPAQTLMENSRIAFVTNRDGNDEIYLMRVDGSDLANLTNDPSTDVDPAWSPDGDRIAFASDRDGAFDIYVMDRDGGNLARLTYTDHMDVHPSWSRHGDRIMFSSDRFQAGPTIYTMDSDGSNQTRIAESVKGDSSPAWSPDISKAALVRPGGGVGQVLTIERMGHLYTDVLRTEIGPGTDVSWAPNALTMAFARFENDSYNIWVRDYDGSRQLLASPTDDREPAWSPDSHRIAFVRETALYIVDVDTNTVTPIATGAASVRAVAWSPWLDLPEDPLSRTRIAYIGWTDANGSGLHIIDADGTNDRWIVRHASQPTWSPDGTRIAFSASYVPPVGGETLNDEIWLIDVDGTDPVRLTVDPARGPDDTWPTWSPDGTQIAFVSDRDGNEEIYRIGVDGTGLVRLTATTATDLAPSWSPDGERLLFVSDGLLLSMRVDGSDVRRLGPWWSAGAPAWSPDGSSVALSTRQSGRSEEIWIASADGLSYRRLTDNARTTDDEDPVWSPDGRKLAFVSDRDNGNSGTVYTMRADGSHPVRLAANISHGPRSVSWSPFLGPDAARITILNPAGGESLWHTTKSVTFDVDIDLHAGGWRWRVNAPFASGGPLAGNAGDNTRQATIRNLVPGKSYTIRTALVDDAGLLLSANGTDSITVTVAPVPIVAVTSPTQGQSLPPGTREIPLSVDIQHHGAHWHWRLNEAFAASGLAGGNHVDAGAESTIAGLRDGVTYTVHAALVHDDHTLLEPVITASSTFTTGDPSYITETVLPQGLSLFALPLDAQRMTFGAHELDLTKRDGGLTAFDLLGVGSTICVRMEQGSMQAVVGRDSEPLFGTDFAIEPARGYVVNMPEETVVTIEGPPFGSRLGAPARASDVGGGWAFVVAGRLADSLHIPSGTRLRLRSGERSVIATVDPTGSFITAFVDSRADDAVVSADTPLFVDALTPDGYPIGGVRPIRVTGAELRDAFKLVTLDLRPTRARLLPNYPNPFNPETWIPFELAEAGRVGLRIYDLSGSLVRSIDLGTREPGYYVIPTDAARWDGRNDAGEAVGSGVYVSELRVGASRDVRRLLIGK